ncbi:hypothetical protein EJ06DRAFT_534575 [Trichodelitschia bisporula]|uniref:Nucleotidyltransferase n=1 Tax=Trichodelitschia bisporula TaxID=703511 RepID=A0A6G1HIQ6_9PEZI|nr:hypothetical protein EJ06DRAFT_534575 [Trichodelitschia bisporula]
MSASLDYFKAMREAAAAVSSVMQSKGVEHAYIGGFAVNLLGGERHTEDIDMQVNLSAPELLQLRAFLLEHDTRFSYEKVNLYFSSSNGHKIPVETLPMPALGLPGALSCVTVGDEVKLPVLQPGLLILTKVKRWAFNRESTRPATVIKARRDLEDIMVLVDKLACDGQHIDF